MQRGEGTHPDGPTKQQPTAHKAAIRYDNPQSPQSSGTQEHLYGENHQDEIINRTSVVLGRAADGTKPGEWRLMSPPQPVHKAAIHGEHWSQDPTTKQPTSRSHKVAHDGVFL